MSGGPSSIRTLAQRVRKFMDAETTRDPGLACLVDRLSESSNAYLFGGVVRDIAIGRRDGRREWVPGDIDIVHEPYSSVDILPVIDGMTFVRNRFGGLRVRTGLWDVDIWEARDTWAFRNGLVAYQGIESILGTTITNWESVLYRIDGGKVICGDAYLDDIERGYLDVVLDVNPNRLGMCVRLMRACSVKEQVSLSGSVIRTVRAVLRDHTSEEIRAYERSRYRKPRLDGKGIRRLRAHIEVADNADRPFSWWGRPDDLFA